jgi:hypothetical protein
MDISIEPNPKGKRIETPRSEEEVLEKDKESSQTKKIEHAWAYIEECSDLITVETFQEIAQKEFEEQQGKTMTWNQKECYKILALIIKAGKAHEEPIEEALDYFSEFIHKPRRHTTIMENWIEFIEDKNVATQARDAMNQLPPKVS